MKNIKETINKIKENDIIIKLTSWSGLGCPGTSGTIITNSKVYYYHYNYFKLDYSIPEYLTIIDLNKKQKNKIEEYLNNELLTLNSIENLVLDAGWEVFINYNNKKISIKNDLDQYNKISKNIERIMKEGK